ncbi:MAG TPA: hypothetical protein VNW50_09880 [Streptosporangiaceae bacterium]|nr:hypothetical protein [Streptosporangiaceae bacterium]
MIRLQISGGQVARSGEPVLVTIGSGRRRFTCHVCQGTVFSGYKVKLNTAVAYRLGDQFAEDGISLVCSDCRYVHTFVPGAVQVWKVRDGYPEGSS